MPFHGDLAAVVVLQYDWRLFAAGIACDAGTYFDFRKRHEEQLVFGMLVDVSLEQHFGQVRAAPVRAWRPDYDQTLHTQSFRC